MTQTHTDYYINVKKQEFLCIKRVYQIYRDKFKPKPELELGPPDLEVRVRVPIQVQIFLLILDNINFQRHKL